MSDEKVYRDIPKFDHSLHKHPIVADFGKKFMDFYGVKVMGKIDLGGGHEILHYDTAFVQLLLQRMIRMETEKEEAIGRLKNIKQSLKGETNE